MPRYDAYVFDLYGTLVDIRTDEESPAAWAAFADDLRRRGAYAQPEWLRERYRTLCATEQRRVSAAQGTADEETEIDVLRVWRAMGLELGVSWDRETLLDVSWTFRRKTTLRLRLFDHAKEVLAALRGQGNTLVLLTNAQSSFTCPELRRLGISHAFDHVLISSECGVKKPSSAFFDRLWRLGLRPERSLMIGNDDRCDCRGAERAHMDSRYLRTEQSPPLSGPLPENCREIASLDAILQE